MKSNTLILLLCAWAILGTMICLFQRQDLADYQAADSTAVANRMEWDSIRQHVPSEGYAGFLRAEKDRDSGFITFWSSGTDINYWSNHVPTFYVSIRYGWADDTKEKTIIELDSADMAYFHKKAISRIAIERKQAIQDVNQVYDNVEKGNLWPFEDSKARWAKAHNITPRL